MESAIFNDIHVQYSSVTTSEGDSPPSTSVDLPNSSPKRRRAVGKRVVKVAMKDLDGAHFNKQGEYCTNPPADSWAWRKYGQKPIKGSPYPRGYYRCSSSKGCPARKQVERSRSDPSFLVVTYSHEHNHSLPVANSRSLKNAVANNNTAAAVGDGGPACKAEEDKCADLAGDLEALIKAEDFAWSLADFEMTSAVFEGSVFSRSGSGADDDLAGYFPMTEGDACESFFADLGELPECSVVFGATAAKEEERIPRAAVAAAPWCSTTG